MDVSSRADDSSSRMFRKVGACSNQDSLSLTYVGVCMYF